MATAASKYEIPRTVRRVLADLRRRIRVAVGLRGLGVVVAMLAGLFWVGMLLDWFLEPSVIVRKWAWLVVGAGSAVAVFRYLILPLRAPLSNASLALLLERHCPALADHVATSVSVAENEKHRGTLNDDLLRRTSNAAEEAIQQVRVSSLVNAAPWLRTVSVAVLLAVSIALLAATAPDTFRFWLQRIALSAEPWPRTVRLQVVGFPRDEQGNLVATIARHDDYRLVVHADLTGQYRAPDKVQIRFRLPDGRRGRDYLTRVGDANEEGGQHQVYQYTFKKVRQPLILDIYGGDDRIRDLKLTVVDRPELVALQVECVYPGYMDRRPQTLSFTRGMQVPVGTELLIRAQVSKPVRRAEIVSNEGQFTDVQNFGDKPTEELEFIYGRLMADESLLVELEDEYGIKSREPYRLSLTSVEDELPELNVRLQGIGTAITPIARIPIVGRVVDDYGIAEAKFDLSGTNEMSTSQVVEFSDLDSTKLEVSETLDLRGSSLDRQLADLDLQPGQQLTFSLSARDHNDIDTKPRWGKSPTFTLDVVTPADLLLQLERYELGYRQRFEAIYEKLTDTRSLLARVDFSASSENGNATADARDESLRQLRLSGSEQNVIQAADEVLSVAEGFEGLHDQLDNNRIEDEELKSRLKQQIAEPLFVIAEDRLPELEQ